MGESGADLPRLGKVEHVERAGRASLISGATAVLGLGRCRPTPGPPAQTRQRDRFVPRPGRSVSTPVTPRATAATLPAPGVAASCSRLAPKGRGFPRTRGPRAGRRSRARRCRRRRLGAGGGGSPSAGRVEGDSRAGEGRRGTAADSDPGRAGPRRSAAATRSPRARELRRTRRLLPPAG